MDGGAVGFVVRRLEDQRYLELLTNSFVMTGTIQCKVEILQNIHAAQQNERMIIRKCNLIEVNFLARHLF